MATNTTPVQCGWCGGVMADVGDGDRTRYECEDCLAVLHPGPKPVDEEVA